jgi:hypothetical protein
MATLSGIVSTANSLAQLAGLFNVQMVNGSYTPPNGVTPVSFHVITALQIPLEQYVSGAIAGFNLLSGAGTDPNTGLFNTNLIADGIDETINRKYSNNRVPLANYDQLASLGTGGQRIVLRLAFAGTMYQTAMNNLVQALFDDSLATPDTPLGSMVHPFYNTINNVLPISFRTVYDYTKLNFMICEVVFLTSDITHLYPNQVANIGADISKWYIGVQNSITSIGGTISAAQNIGTNTIAGLGL